MMDLKESDILGESINNHWYYNSKAKAVVALLQELEVKSILDVGAGSGFFSRYLLDNSSAESAWCVDISYEQDSDEMHGCKPIHFRKAIDSLEVELVLLMDVLEHVDDDVKLLKYYVNRVPSGARFLISVPAFQFMWSGHDIFLEHRRRYRLKQIEHVVKESGLSIITGVYYFGTIFPIAMFSRALGGIFSRKYSEPRSQLKQHSSIINFVLSAICNLEVPLMQFNRVAGLTAFCVAEKK